MAGFAGALRGVVRGALPHPTATHTARIFRIFPDGTEPARRLSSAA
jgi:hypothetical protein